MGEDKGDFDLATIGPDVRDEPDVREKDVRSAKERIGRYEVLRRLAVGGMAEIFLARSLGIEGFRKDVVIKRMLPQYSQHELMVEMFLDEARIAGRLRHPNIAQVFDIGEEDGEYFFAMEYIHGEDVGALLRQCHRGGSALPIEHAVGITIATAAGLDHAHNLEDDQGRLLDVVHRDVSPSNVMIGYDGTAKLVDFGIAKARERVHVTSEGGVKGKFAYMSPEQHRGDEIDRRSDIFSLGIVLCEMATGVPVFTSSSPLKSRELIVSGTYVLPSQLRSDFPTDLEAIIVRAMRPDPDERYESAGAMLLDLEAFARENRLPVSTTGLGVFVRERFAAKLASRESGSDGPQKQELSLHLDGLFGSEGRRTEAGMSHTTEVDPGTEVPMPDASGWGRRRATAAPTASRGLTTGSIIASRYCIISKLGQGGMGTVYIAQQRPLERRVALKVLNSRTDAEARERFVREARAASRLNHPNIATVYDFGEAEQGPFLAMELVEGFTLRHLMDEIRPMPWRRALALATQIARGLAAAHREGIVHRDIKPANVALPSSAEGEDLKILDFGLANRTDNGSDDLTKAGVVMGTPAYVSPEQVDGVSDDVRSDLYALGVILYEMLAGRHPFGSRPAMALLVAHVSETPSALADVTSDIPQPVCQLVDQLLCKNPSDRPEDGAALVQALGAAAQRESPTAISAEVSWLRPARDGAPEGRVTLVFTGIEGSAELWDRPPKAVRRALDLHDAIVRETLREAGGYELKAHGDAFIVAFNDELGAIRWCLDVQRELSRQEWPTELFADKNRSDSADWQVRRPGLRVRMGVHVGNPECRRDTVTGRMDYVGPAVARAASIERAAHGGQIMVSDELAGVIAKDLQALGATAEPRGEYWIEAEGTSQRLIEVVDVRGHPRAFPPPRSPESERRTNLSLDHSAFVGREREREQLSKRFSSGARLITLVGPGGTGKTRLARVVAGDMLASSEGPDEVWFCDLSPATGAMELTAIVADVLSVPLASGEALQDAVELVGRALERRGKMLLVVDNLEQVLAAAPQTIGTWLRKAPELLVLATSREGLGVVSEERTELDPLDVNDGSRLFAARVGELGLPPTGDEPAVRQLVEALDGIPLAIELAASRAGLMTPRQIHARLNRRFDLLRGSRRDVSERQMTLRGAIDWSWDLLSPVERDAFTQLSVFEGGVAIEAAEEILDLFAHEDAPFVLDVVQALKDKSLLRAEPAVNNILRLNMLGSIQEYALDRLGETDDSGVAVRRRHAEFFVREGKRHAKATRTRRGRDAMVWLASNRQNLLAVTERFRAVDAGIAVSAALALVPLLADRAPTDVHRALLDDAIELARDAEDDAVLAEALLHRADLEQERGSAEVALEFVEEARSLLGPKRAPVLRAVALVRRGRILYRMGRLEQGAAAFDEAEPLARAHGAHSLVARILTQRGLMALAKLDPPQDLFARALKLARRSGDSNMEARILGNQGVDQMVRGDLAGAERRMQLALALHRDNGARGLEGMTMGNLGLVTLALGRPDDSERWLRGAIAIHQELGNELLEGADRGNLAGTLIQQSRYRTGIELAQQALPLILANNGAREQLFCRCILATGYAAVDDVDAARASLEAARQSKVPFWKSLESLFTLVGAHLKLAEARMSGGAADDVRLAEVHEIIEMLRSANEMLFLSLRTLEHVFACYPAPPPDLSDLPGDRAQ